mmetsp:Transcript_98928/g.318995  ORF Transcript_98928/g.318995 Transcript_98928/m.318995 type:complete len:121 (+) Transcript_98928:82-444(+)
MPTKDPLHSAPPLPPARRALIEAAVEGGMPSKAPPPCAPLLPPARRALIAAAVEGEAAETKATGKHSSCRNAASGFMDPAIERILFLRALQLVREGGGPLRSRLPPRPQSALARLETGGQ